MQIATIYTLFGARCCYCKATVTKRRRGDPAYFATKDHRIPRSRGGGGGDNLVLACRACNELKGSWTDQEFLALFPNGAPVEYRLAFSRRLTASRQTVREHRKTLRAILATLARQPADFFSDTRDGEAA